MFIFHRTDYRFPGFKKTAQVYTRGFLDKVNRISKKQKQ